MTTREQAAIFLDPKAERRCGTCTACCETPAIDEPTLKKPAHTRCEKLYSIGGSQRGCSDYEGRPETCRAFTCMWLLGMGHKDDRPDKTGVILQVQDVGVPGVRDLNTRVEIQWMRRALLGVGAHAGTDPNGNHAFIALESWKDAARREGAHVVVGISNVAPLFVIPKTGEKRLHGPPWWTANLVRMTLEEAGGQPIPVSLAMPPVVDPADVRYCSCPEPVFLDVHPPRCSACGLGKIPVADDSEGVAQDADAPAVDAAFEAKS